MAEEREIEGSVEVFKRQVMSELLRAGWPSMDMYVKGLPTYKDRTEASELHRQFLVDLTDAVISKQIEWKIAVDLGPCAKDNLPRAMFLLGMVDEGGPHVQLPKRWPQLKEEPDGTVG